MIFIYTLILLGLSLTTSEMIPGVQPGGLDKMENEDVQRNCGLAGLRSKKPVKKILYGQNVSSDEVFNKSMWMARLIYTFDDGSWSDCTGVLISRRHVLTAAHCMGFIANETICHDDTLKHEVKFESTNVSSYKVRVYTRFGHKMDAKAGRTHEVKRVIFPSTWTGDSLVHLCKSYNNDTEDIAIYELKEPVALPTFVCLANVSLPFQTLTNYGYGTTGLEENIAVREPNILKKQIVKYINCTGIPVLEGMSCIQHATMNVTTSCGGDSGGPVVGTYYNRAFTVGIMTDAMPCDQIKKDVEDKSIPPFTAPNLITSVPYYKNWICKWTRICVYGANPTKDKRPTAIWEYTGEKRIV